MFGLFLLRSNVFTKFPTVNGAVTPDGFSLKFTPMSGGEAHSVVVRDSIMNEITPEKIKDRSKFSSEELDEVWCYTDAAPITAGVEETYSYTNCRFQVRMYMTSQNVHTSLSIVTDTQCLPNHLPHYLCPEDCICHIVRRIWSGP